MTGGHNVTIEIEAYCGSCPDRQFPMKLIGDVEHGEGEYQCPQCQRTVVVSLRLGN